MSSNYSDPSAMDANFPGPEQKPRGWWSRNWKWFVPTVLLCMFVICCGFPGVVGYIIYKNPDIIKSKIEPYVKTMDKLRSNPEVQEAFGQPIRDDSWMPGGNVNNGLFWDIAGPKGKGKVYLRTRIINDKWEIVRIEVTTPDDKKIVIPGEGEGGRRGPAL